MRVAIVTESFLPALNGVTTSVCKVLESLRAQGHDALVIAPGTSPWSPTMTPEHYAGFPVHSVTSVPVRQFRVGLPSYEIETVLHRFRPDVMHVASPFVLGVRGLTAARALGIPSVAIYQTDMPSYIRQHSGPAGDLTARAAWRWIRRIHQQADLTLAPSSAALQDLAAHDVPRIAQWGRGVDSDLFHPARRTDPGTAALRARLAPRGETLLGYVGRLAPEKELHRLVELARVPGTRLVLVGEGPSSEMLAASLPGAVFLGRREGEDLARAYAAFDVFVHTGTRETFGQTIQEAAAAGLPVVAPARGGPLDLVEVGVTGDLFDPDRPGDLAAKVAPLVGPEAAELRERMGLAARDRVVTRSWPALVEQLLDHYALAIRDFSRSVA
ncbi:glycosyltransferase family 4 protein [Ornithinimicrobium tianjinense]|uniref:D-inositol 3-phosphate glycosyltransferase n=1 Tax=Ornithinimicrobium tianjinense TaxID=1195761 RepID=A0A917BM62_9MICO|nr:glycosyltransferase family 1 protein [Ornithinimicrobium tianjinense]GGF51513.1 GDP-mannose-dependent alpha-mannosyltransferase [Ornithinimicrobium tianjinense]